MSIKYTIQTSRRTAILYLAREYGTAVAVRLLRKIKCTNGTYNLTPYVIADGIVKNKKGEMFFKTKKAANKSVPRIEQLAAWNAGKLNRRMVGITTVEYNF